MWIDDPGGPFVTPFLLRRGVHPLGGGVGSHPMMSAAMRAPLMQFASRNAPQDYSPEWHTVGGVLIEPTYSLRFSRHWAALGVTAPWRSFRVDAISGERTPTKVEPSLVRSGDVVVDWGVNTIRVVVNAFEITFADREPLSVARDAWHLGDRESATRIAREVLAHTHEVFLAACELDRLTSASA